MWAEHIYVQTCIYVPSHTQTRGAKGKSHKNTENLTSRCTCWAHGQGVAWSSRLSISWRVSWVPTAQPDKLSVIPSVHMEKEQKQLLEAVLRPPPRGGIISQRHTYINFFKRVVKRKFIMFQALCHIFSSHSDPMPGKDTEALGVWMCLRSGF